ncbi:MAG: CAP domain-containing protein [Actinomycetota bacterium]
MRRAPDHSRPGTNRRGARIQIGILFVMVVALLGPITTRDTGTAAATSSDEAAFFEALNEVRAGAGLPAFTLNTQLSDLSRGHAQVMADAGEIFHASPISAGYNGPWSKIGENVGVGANVSVLVDAFVASPGHYANIVDPSFTEVGIGVVWRENALYTTHRFLEVPGAPVTTAPPVPTTSAQPVPTTTVPAPTTTAPAPPAEPVDEPTTDTLAPPQISADRVVTLLDLLDQVGS